MTAAHHASLKANYKYVFRTASHAAMDNVGAVRYLKARNVKIEGFNMINQDYAWGHDSLKDFTLSMQVLYPQSKALSDQRPKFGAGQYGTEISQLMSNPADVTHSSLWGGDLQAMICKLHHAAYLKNHKSFSQLQIMYSHH
jgi:branched-chain amino acid transport system substrate-binding protein